MSKRTKIILTIVIVALLALIAFLVWSKVIAPYQQSLTPTPTPTPIATPTPTPLPNPTPVPVVTKGTVAGQADTKTLHIKKIIIYDASGKNVVTTQSLDANGMYSIDLDAGNYKIDYEASPDNLPHSPEAIIVNAGQTHEVDFIVQ
jgi:hypothetical protein